MGTGKKVKVNTKMNTVYTQICIMQWLIFSKQKDPGIEKHQPAGPKTAAITVLRETGGKKPTE